MLKKWGVTIAILLAATQHVLAQGYGIGTPIEAKRMVENTIAHMRSQGVEKTLQELNKANGKFQWRDLYAFAYDTEGVMRAHPNQFLIGYNLLDQPDAKGKLFRQELIELANSRGHAWVDYTYLNPRSRAEQSKITYCAKEGELIVCCGAYLH